MKIKVLASILILLASFNLSFLPRAGSDAYAAADCTRTSIGVTPINDLGSGFYQGRQGGLYPGGSNVDPPAHRSLGESVAQTITPLDANGVSDSINGKIVLSSIGMSNTRSEFAGTDGGGNFFASGAFKPQADNDPAKNPQVVIVNGAQGSKGIDEWLADDPLTWDDLVNNKLPAAGVTYQQVQVIWLKQVEREITISTFPEDAMLFKSKLEDLVRMAKVRLPNLKIVYMSSRIYGGYSERSDRGEPYAHNSGWGVKWAIEDQINGTGNLGLDVAPWIAWGPYLWADGINVRSDGLNWLCSDFKSDGVHPNEVGVKKVGDRLLAHFKTDTTACIWFSPTICGPQAPVANAGFDKTVSDSDSDGMETVTLDGSGSYDPDGTIVSYEWKEGATVLGAGAIITASLALGTHAITLTVVDNDGATSTDTVIVTITALSTGIVFDSVSDANTGASRLSSLTWSHTVGSGPNRLLIVGVSIRNKEDQTVSSITYNGAQLTKIGSAKRSSAVRSELWYLKNPTSGISNMVVTLAKAGYFVAGATSYTGVDQSSPLGTRVTANGKSTTPRVNVTSAANQVVVDVVSSRNSSYTLAAGAGQTQRYQGVTTSGTSSNNVRSGGSTEGGASTVTMSWILSGSTDWAIVAVPLKPAL